MRPRVFPAEDLPQNGSIIGVTRFNEAAGIPRGRQNAGRGRAARLLASMRPRVFPAEDGSMARHTDFDRARFNEAAGIPRGRPSRSRRKVAGFELGFNEAAGIPRGRHERAMRAQMADPRASMRPRVFPAEDPAAVLNVQDDVASMRPRVFPAEDKRRRLTWPGRTCFNEAAGIPRGRLDQERRRSWPAGRRASMRPRVFPAEDGSVGVVAGGRRAPADASMRPRVFPAEDRVRRPTARRFTAGHPPLQ